MSDYYNDIVNEVKQLKIKIYDKIDMDKKYLSLDQDNITTINEYENLIKDFDYQYDKLIKYSENNSSNKKVYVVLQSMRNTKNDVIKMIEEIKNKDII